MDKLPIISVILGYGQIVPSPKFQVPFPLDLQKLSGSSNWIPEPWHKLGYTYQTMYENINLLSKPIDFMQYL